MVTFILSLLHYIISFGFIHILLNAIKQKEEKSRRISKISEIFENVF